MSELETTLHSFRHYLDRIDRLVGRLAADDDATDLLSTKVSPDSFETAQQLGIALYFAARGVFPVAARELPPFPERFDVTVLQGLAADIRAILAEISPAALANAPVPHTAGFAELEQAPADYMIRFALPNMVFHYAMAYAALRGAGFAIGKADFDGLHSYPDNFSFKD